LKTKNAALAHSSTRLQDLPRLWLRSRNVLIVPDASQRSEQLNRDIKNEVDTLVVLLPDEESIANGLHFGRESPPCFQMPDVLLGIMEY